MKIPNYTVDNFVVMFLGLAPPGKAWAGNDDVVQTNIVTGLMKSTAVLSSRALNLLTDAFPSTSLELLSEWESTLGLPDPCAGTSPTIQQRRAQVVARFANSGGQSIPYFINFASNLGYQVTTKEYAPFRCGQSHCGDQLGSQDWSFTWAIVAPKNTVINFRAGASAAGEALGVWQNAVLECELTTVKPAHTILNFVYV